jgi:tripartite-type tricarboxylate transporter receptor subunit TctC
MSPRRALLGGALGAIAALPLSPALWPRPARAAWPDRPIRVIVPFAAGGNTDVVTRIISQAMQEIIGKPFVVENRAGGAGSLGAEMAARATPDGHTLLAGSGGSLTANPVLQNNLPYDTERDFAPIGLVSRVPIVLVVAPGFTARSWPDFLALAKATPQQLNIATPAVGTTAHFALELLNVQAGARLVHVPYRGGGSMVTDLLAGNFDGALLEMTTALPLHQEGKARILAVAAPERVPQLPGIATFIEGGLAGFTSTSFTGLLAPRGTPAEVITTLRLALLGGLATPAVAQRLVALGCNPATPEEASPAGLAAYLHEELAKYRQAARLAGLKAE